MSKEYSEAFKTIKIKCHPNSNPSPVVDEALDTVEKALERLESIDNAKPSEALETLKDMLIGNGCNDSINDYVDNLILPIKQALIKTQEYTGVLKKYNIENIEELEKILKIFFMKKDKCE